MFKNISMLNRDLSRLVIIDDNPMSYAFHTRNAIPIDKFEGEDDDVLLQLLSSIFERLKVWLCKYLIDSFSIED